MRSGLLLFFLPFVVWAGAVSTPEEFFYQKGYQEGFQKGKQIGYIEGYKQAIRDFKKVLAMYRKDLEALEAGKYLMEEEQITYPRIVKTPDGRIKIIGCRFESLRSLDELPKMEIPIISAVEVQEYKKARERLLTIPKLSQEVETAYQTPPKPIIVPVPKDKKGLLEKLNIPYMVDAKGNIRAIFFSKEDYMRFEKLIGD